MRTFVVGDIHGACAALRQCLERSGFDKEKDRLICLGDVSDGWPETKQAIDELLSIQNLVYILGNHDVWTYQWMLMREAPEIWLTQGGLSTVDSYSNEIPEEHIQLFRRAKEYLLEDDLLFVHAGILPQTKVEQNNRSIFLWDRTMVKSAVALSRTKPETRLTPYREVFVGHTPIAVPQPMKYCDVWMMDTGAGWSGVLSIMNIETKEWFISDPVPSLYPEHQGRG